MFITLCIKSIQILKLWTIYLQLILTAFKSGFSNLTVGCIVKTGIYECVITLFMYKFYNLYSGVQKPLPVTQLVPVCASFILSSFLNFLTSDHNLNLLWTFLKLFFCEPDLNSINKAIFYWSLLILSCIFLYISRSINIYHYV